MPTVNLELNEADLNSLRHAYEVAREESARAGESSAPLSFEQWLALAVMSGTRTDASNPGANDLASMQFFNVIERLVTSLPRHGFELAHKALPTASASRSALDLASMMVTDFTLAPQYLHRIQQLFEHYLKSANDIANESHVGVTKRTYGALHEAFRQLCDRTVDSLDHLGESRAVGRVEGASAILVSLGVLDRPAAQTKVNLFKAHVRGPKKSEWPRIR